MYNWDIYNHTKNELVIQIPSENYSTDILEIVLSILLL